MPFPFLNRMRQGIMAARGLSTISYYHRYFQFLKYVGIVPYKLQFEVDAKLDSKSSTGESNSKVVTSVNFERRANIWALLHQLTLIIFTCYLSFACVQMYARCTSGVATTLELFSLSCWLWKPMTVGFLFLWFHIKKEDF